MDETRTKAADLWIALASIYGPRWISTYGVDPDPIWARAIASIPGPALTQALQACLERGSEWPPNLPEFLAMCRPARVVDYEPWMATGVDETQKRLEHLRSRVTAPGDARAHVQRMREILRGKRQEEVSNERLD
jgi:hypothetical protein